MEDIRNTKKIKKLQKQIKMRKFFLNVLKNWWKILILIIVILVAVFPTYVGYGLGWWWNEFVISFLEKLTYLR